MKKITFEVKEEHLKLLRSMNVGWQQNEFGAPEIDPKRPYGSDAYDDMVEILGGKKVRGNLFKLELFGKDYFIIDGEFEEDLETVLNKLHRETETALQIVLNTGQFKSGKYECDEYGVDWKLVG